MESEKLKPMRNILVLLCILLSSLTAYCQSKTDTIKTRSFLGTHSYTLGNKTLSIFSLNQKVSLNAHAAPEMQLAYKNFKMGATCKIVGAGCLGWSIGTILAKHNPNYVIGGVGLGFLGVSIRFDHNFKSHARVAIRIFNSEAK